MVLVLNLVVDPVPGMVVNNISRAEVLQYREKVEAYVKGQYEEE